MDQDTLPAYSAHTFKRATIPIINERTVNSTFGFKGFHLSYNPSIINYGSATTALVLKGTLFFILNGDHRKELYEAANEKGMQGCIDYFVRNISEANKLSEHYIVIGVQKDYFNLRNTALEIIGQSNIDLISKASGVS